MDYKYIPGSKEKAQKRRQQQGARPTDITRNTTSKQGKKERF